MASHVFLGGTCNGSQWRQALIPKLTCTYFDPVITDREWTTEDGVREQEERANSQFCTYVLTPRMEGFASIAEVVQDSNERALQTILCVLSADAGQEWTPHQLKSLEFTKNIVAQNGAYVCGSLDDVAALLNA